MAGYTGCGAWMYSTPEVRVFGPATGGAGGALATTTGALGTGALSATAATVCGTVIAFCTAIWTTGTCGTCISGGACATLTVLGTAGGVAGGVGGATNVTITAGGMATVTIRFKVPL